MEQALRDSEERYRSTLDGMLEGCQIIGFDWRYLYVNDAVARHGRRAKEQLLGHTMMEMYPGMEETELFGHLRRCMEERVPRRMENEFTYPDGAKAWFELTIEPVPEGIFILSLDVTERKRAEEALRESEERFRLLAEHAQDIIFRYSRADTWKCEYISPAVVGVAGYAPEQFYADAEFVLQIIHLDDQETFRQMIEERWAGPVELRWISKDGSTIWTEQRNTPVYDESGQLIAMEGIVRDITERKRAEEALARAREQLEEGVERRLGRDPYGLTFRELTVLHLVAAGKTDREIAGGLGISHLTVHKHVGNILGKMHASSRTEAGVRALREGLLS